MDPSQARYRLVPYVNPNGRMPVQEFMIELQESDPEAYVKFQDVIRPLLEELGPRTPMPHFKALPPTDFSEIRWDGAGHVHYRIYCTIEDGGKIVLYHAVPKTWLKFDRSDKRICRTRYNDYRQSTYDAAARINARDRA